MQDNRVLRWLNHEGFEVSICLGHRDLYSTGLSGHPGFRYCMLLKEAIKLTPFVLPEKYKAIIMLEAKNL